MTDIRICDALNNRVAADSTVTIKGWVRTRRDSKQGLSFVNVHDGSCFDPIQVVIDAAIPNYETEILHLTTGCSVIVTCVHAPTPSALSPGYVTALPRPYIAI